MEEKKLTNTKWFLSVKICYWTFDSRFIIKQFKEVILLISNFISFFYFKVFYDKMCAIELLYTDKTILLKYLKIS